MVGLLSQRKAGLKWCDEDSWKQYARKFAQAFSDAGWRGIVNVQGMWNESVGYSTFEFNGRFNGSTAARKLLGFDDVGLTLNAWFGEEVIPPYQGPVYDEIVVQPSWQGVSATLQSDQVARDRVVGATSPN